MRAGDIVAILVGGKVLYILRSSETVPSKETYTFVGECYVHGFMSGEAVHGLEEKGMLDSRVNRFRLV